MRQRKHIKMAFNSWSRGKSSTNREKQLMIRGMQKHRHRSRQENRGWLYTEQNLTRDGMDIRHF